MSQTLPVRINRETPHEIDLDSTDFDSTGGFELAIENRGEASHVHVHLDDTLSRVAALEGTNHFVEAGKTQRITVSVRDGPRPVTGKLKIVTGYGAETAYVDVTIREPVEPERSVTVDEDLARPKPATGSSEPAVLDLVKGISAGGNLALLALAGAALVVAATAISFANGFAVIVGAFLVAVAIVVALFTLIS